MEPIQRNLFTKPSKLRERIADALTAVVVGLGLTLCALEYFDILKGGL